MIKEIHWFPDYGTLPSASKNGFNEMKVIWLAFGSNSHGAHGPPDAAICHAIRRLSRQNFAICSRSGLFLTPPMGSGRQPPYVNAVIGIQGSIAPAALLRLLKRLEREAGRRAGVRWGPRPLDIDILDHGGRIIGYPAIATRRDTLILPHPGIAARGFVLLPLAKAAPQWRHPVLGVGARAMLARRPNLRRGIVDLGHATKD